MQTSTVTVSPARADRIRVCVATLVACLASPAAPAAEWSGDAGIEVRGFTGSPLDAAQHRSNVSVYAQPEFYHDWDDGDQRFVFTPFLRLDQGDPERSHGDLRELYWRKSFAAVDLSIGLKKVFWGVTESAHVVDVINQTDLVENVDTEDKLGQPMVNLTFLNDWGTVDLFLMPWFRERTFAGREGRLRPPFYVAADAARYESSAERKHIDLAVRWSHYFGDWDIGLAHFSGTSREPQLLLTGFDEIPVVTPFYDQIEQTSIELQATKGAWLWKFEGYHRTGQGDSFQAFAAGFEYTLVGLFGSAIDLGLIGEYLRDNRDALAVLSDDDVAAGFRLAFNDVQSTDLLAFAGIDRDTREIFASVEGSRRLGQSWRLELEARFFANTGPDSTLHTLRKDDYVELSLAKFF